MNMRKIIAVLSAALLLCAAIPMSALTVAAAGDVVIDYNFDDGVAHFERGYVENGYMVFDGTTASWQNTYLYANAMKANTDYVATFKAKANKDANLGLKINNNWAGDTAKKYVSVTTEWQDFEIMFNTNELADLTSTALVMFYSPYDAAVAPIYCIDDLKIVEKKEELEVGVVKNGDFENGSEGWILNSSASIENGALKLDNSGQWSEAAMAEIAVEVGTEYTLSWKSQRVSGSGAFLMFVLNSTNGKHPADGTNWMNSTSTDWIEQSIKFTAEEANLKLKLSAEVDNPGVILIDDIKLTATPKPVVGQIINGDFETGKADGWNLPQQGSVTADAAHSGNYGINIKGNGGWGGMLDQHISIEDGKTYEFSFWYKVNASGFNWKLTGDASGTVYGSGWVTTNEWTQVTKTFVAAGDTSIFLNINGGGNGVAENAYIDDVMIKEVKDPSFDGYIYNGDFETGKTDSWDPVWWAGNISVVEGRNGGYAMQLNHGMYQLTRQLVTVEPNTDYVVQCYAKNVSNMTLLAKSYPADANIAQAGMSGSDNWTQNSLVFNSGDCTQVYICVMGNVDGSTAIVDDFFMFEKVEESNDGYIINGTFETGALTPWNNLWGSCPKAEVIKGGLDSNFALEIISGQWKHVRQTNIAVEANTDYKITAWAKNAAGMSLLVKDGGDSKDIVNAGIEAGEEWTEFVITFNTGDYTSIIFSLMGNNAEAAFGTFDNIVMEKVVACEHDYQLTDGTFPTCETEGSATYTCSICGDSYTEDLPAYHNGGMEYTPAKEAIDCANPGNIENYYCPGCNEYFADAYAQEIINPWYIEVTVDCVKPEGLADCAGWTCETCGNENFGAGEHDVLICQGGTCSKCNAEIEGVGCQNLDTPACEDGVCHYCGGFVAGFGHENGAWAPCCDGECSYGCGLIYPATEDHVDADADDYCDNCWNHLACIDADADGFCDVCWSEMPAAEILYGDANGDGAVNNIDVALLQQYIAGYDVTLEEVSADANGDGAVNNIDVALLQQYIAGYDVTLGPV